MLKHEWIEHALETNPAFSFPIARTLAIFFDYFARRHLRSLRTVRSELEVLLSNCYMGALGYVVSLDRKIPIRLFSPGQTIDYVGIGNDAGSTATSFSYDIYSRLIKRKPIVSKPVVIVVRDSVKTAVQHFNLVAHSHSGRPSCLVLPPYEENLVCLLEERDYDIFHECQDDLFHSPYPYPTSEPGKVKLVRLTRGSSPLAVSKKTTLEGGTREAANYLKLQTLLPKIAIQEGVHIQLRGVQPIGLIKTPRKAYYFLTRYEKGASLESLLLSGHARRFHVSLVKYIYDCLSSLGIAWRDFSPRNVLVRSPRSRSYELILCDFERNSFFGPAPLNRKWKALVGILAREEFSNSLKQEELSTIFEPDRRVFKAQANMEFVSSRRVKAQLDVRESAKSVRIKDLIHAMQVCYLSAVPTKRSHQHLSLLYPLDLLSYAADITTRLDVMNSIIAWSAERARMASLLQSLATAVTIVYLYDNTERIRLHSNSALWREFGKVCLEILASVNPDPRSAILNRLQSILPPSEGERLMPLICRLISK